MNTFFGLLWLVANVVMIVFIVKAIKEKDADAKKQKRKIWLICLAVAVVAFVVFAVTTSSDESLNDESSNLETEQISESENEDTSGDDIESLKAELKEKYDISEPMSFPRGDTTGKWKYVTVANGTSPEKYAVDYAKAYMTEGDVHYIVNFSLKTTSQFTLLNDILEVKITEYVEDEEHDASVIGEGMQLGDYCFNMTTGEPITTEGSTEAGTVDADSLVSKVKEVIAGEVGQGEKISDVSFDGEGLVVKVDLSGADTSHLSKELIAESRVGSITDAILQLDDSYYNTWNTITVDFGSIGSITYTKNDVKDQGYGRFFDVPVGYFE